MMEEALRIKRTRGTLDAADHLHRKGIPYELALIALVGLRYAVKRYGLEAVNVSSLKRGRQRPQLKVVK